MKKTAVIIITFLTLSLFYNCTYVKNKMSGKQVYAAPLNQFPYPISNLEKGTQLKLIALAFGEETDKDHTYYYQFLTINQSNGDTVRVLAPIISVGPENTYTSPSLYNHDKGIETATFIPKDSSFDFKINAIASPERLETDPNAFDKMQSKSNAEEMVLLVKGVPLFENSHYKTVIGALHFDEQPW